jgi:dipeptidyl aminopeptidase/acylaminoacyl peptidase
VHEYGGGAYTVEGSTVVFVHDGDRCLWRLDLPPGSGDMPPAAFRRLTPPAPPATPRAFADGLLDRHRDRWLGVMEAGERDHLVEVPLGGGPPRTLHQAADFCGYAVLSPDGHRLAWVEWQRPAMPWERSRLWLGWLDGAGRLVEKRCVAGSAGNEGQAVSVFQPLWAGPDLVVANDRGGWWNLERLRDAASLQPDGALRWDALLPMQAEFAMPQWTFGMRTTAWDGERLVAAACRTGLWQLGRIEAVGAPAWRWLDLPFTEFGGLTAERGELVALAASPTAGTGLLQLDTGSGSWNHVPAAPRPLPIESISVAEPLWFEGWGGRRTHAWYYPPAGERGSEAPPPLLVKGHSGPTGMAATGLSPTIQFWTSRGWGVVDVNYGGSTGFGRAYRQRLDGGWGVVDVHDCAAAARALVAAGRADPERVAIEGGSAAGFTVLAALCFTDVFRAGACRYAVADLAALARDTHRFEAGYLDGLVGPWPAARERYEARSPLFHADRIRCPVIFFQGLADRVVPPEQTRAMVEALEHRGVPVEMHLFPGEGHGFRDGRVRIRVLEATEAFFRRHLDL